MSDFNYDLFTKSVYYEETLLREHKATIEYWNNEKKLNSYAILLLSLTLPD